MLHFSPWKQVAIILTCLLGVLLVLPNFFSKETLAQWPSWVPRTQLNLGLDLRGGAHLLLAMETADVRKDWLETLRDDARKRLRDAKIAVHGARHRQQRGAGAARQAGGRRRGHEGAARARPADRQPHPRHHRHRPRGDARATAALIIDHADRGRPAAAHHPTPSAPPSRPCAGASTPWAPPSPTIVRQGARRILVQVPGLQDTAQLKELIGKTARLSFHEVHRTHVRRGGARRRACRRATRSIAGDDREEGAAAAARDAGGARRRAGRLRSPASTSAPTSRSSPSASTTPARASSATSPRTTSTGRSPSCSTTR